MKHMLGYIFIGFIVFLFGIPIDAYYTNKYGNENKYWARHTLIAIFWPVGVPIYLLGLIIWCFYKLFHHAFKR